MSREENYYTATEFEIEEVYGYYLARPMGDFRDAFDNKIEFEVLFEADSSGNITTFDVCETGIWGNIYWSEKTKRLPHNRMFIRNIQNQLKNIKEKVA